MNLLTDALGCLGAVLLPLVAALLLEELTYGGLVRLLIAPRPGARKRGVPSDAQRAPTTSMGCKRREHNRTKGERK